MALQWYEINRNYDKTVYRIYLNLSSLWLINETFIVFVLICFYAILVYKQVRNKASLHLLYSLHVARVKEHKGTNVFYCKTFLLKWINVFYLSSPYLIFFKAGFKVLPSKLVIVCQRSLLIRLQKCISLISFSNICSKPNVLCIASIQYLYVCWVELLI